MADEKTERVRGRTVASNGYVLVRVGRDHHLADVRGYAYEHRVVAEQMIGRRLELGEQVHHIDGDRANNAASNLMVHRSRAHHAVEHRTRDDLRKPGEFNPTVACKCGCAQTFSRFDGAGRPRLYVSGHNRPARPTVDAVIRALRGGDSSRSVIAAATGRSVQAIAVALSKLKARGVVANARGTWRLVTGVHDG